MIHDVDIDGLTISLAADRLRKPIDEELAGENLAGPPIEVSRVFLWRVSAVLKAVSDPPERRSFPSLPLGIS